MERTYYRDQGAGNHRAKGAVCFMILSSFTEIRSLSL